MFAEGLLVVAVRRVWVQSDMGVTGGVWTVDCRPASVGTFFPVVPFSGLFEFWWVGRVDES